MTHITAFIGNDTPTVVLGTALVLAVLAFGWFEHRRTSRLPQLGMVMVKNRLHNSR